MSHSWQNPKCETICLTFSLIGSQEKYKKERSPRKLIKFLIRVIWLSCCHFSHHRSLFSDWIHHTLRIHKMVAQRSHWRLTISLHNYRQFTNPPNACSNEHLQKAVEVCFRRALPDSSFSAPNPLTSSFSLLNPLCFIRSLHYPQLSRDIFRFHSVLIIALRLLPGVLTASIWYPAVPPAVLLRQLATVIYRKSLPVQGSKFALWTVDIPRKQGRFWLVFPSRIPLALQAIRNAPQLWKITPKNDEKAIISSAQT